MRTGIHRSLMIIAISVVPFAAACSPYRAKPASAPTTPAARPTTPATGTPLERASGAARVQPQQSGVAPLPGATPLRSRVGTGTPPGAARPVTPVVTGATLARFQRLAGCVTRAGVKIAPPEIGQRFDRSPMDAIAQTPLWQKVLVACPEWQEVASGG
jgi:hypothetical protein